MPTSSLAAASTDDGREPDAPVIPPIPTQVDGVAQPVVDLAGTWYYTCSRAEQFWTSQTGHGDWARVVVPGEPAMQGVAVPPDVECAYRTTFTVPDDYSGNTVYLRFDGVYSYARVWIDGDYVTEHDGGFSTWYADVSAHTRPGRQCTLTVGVTDRSDSITGASAYAQHTIGGILRDVSLIALPREHVVSLHTETTFDDDYDDATLSVRVRTRRPDSGRAVLGLELADGEETYWSGEVELHGPDAVADLDMHVRSPRKWDAEHPNLYNLIATLTSPSGRQTVTQRIGFREVRVRGNELHVNGRRVHLRGANHHHISAELGRTTSPALDEQDIVLFKEANLNFLRTSHYPPTPALLDAADRLGMYVEEETAICWQRTTVDDPAFEARYLDQFAAMIERDRNHACVIEWSLGNETRHGRNLAAENDLAHALDPSRPTVFEDAGQYNGGDQADIYSGHYPSWDDVLGNPVQPLQFGEIAHVPCYDVDELRTDPGVHEFWGRSITRFAEAMHACGSAVGSAIWSGIDDVFLLPGNTVGFGGWGIVDIWRRRKPEHWLTKKAFSPIRIQDQPLTDAVPGTALCVSVTNWFDFTDLSELQIHWRIGERSGTVADVAVPPQTQGRLRIPVEDWVAGATLNLRFVADGSLIDEFALPLGVAPVPRVTAARDSGAPRVSQTSSHIEVRGTQVPFVVVVDKATGRIVEASVDGSVILIDGPQLVLGRTVLTPWRMESLSTASAADGLVITSGGRYGPVEVGVSLTIGGDGLITTDYEIVNPPVAPSRGFSAVGLEYRMVPDLDAISWERDAQWSVYPHDHIGRGRGTANKGHVPEPGAENGRPSWAWSQDTSDYLHTADKDHSGWTNDMRASKADVEFVEARTRGAGLRVESDGRDAVRLAPAGRSGAHDDAGAHRYVSLLVMNRHSYPDINRFPDSEQVTWGNYAPRPIVLQSHCTGTVRLRLVGTV